MPITINGNSVNGVLEANVVGQNYAVPYSMLSDISSQLIDLSNAVTDLSGVVTDLSGSFTDLSGSFTDLSGSFADLSGSFTDLSGSFADLSGSFADLSGSFTDLSGSFTDLSGSFADLSGSFTDLSGSFADLSGSFTDLSGIVYDLSNTVVDICNQLVIIDNSINILEGDLFEASYNELYLKKPNPVIDLSGSYNSTDTRIELEWALPTQIRAANNFTSGTHQTVIEKVFSPSLLAPHAPYYPSGYGGNLISGTQSTTPDPPQNDTSLNLTVPAYATGLYPSLATDPSFSDLNWLPYHQNIGIDVRRRLPTGTISDWCPLRPNDLRYVKAPQHLWAGTRGFYIRNDTNYTSTVGGDYSPNGNNGNTPGPGGTQGDHIYQLTNSPVFTVQGQAGAGFQFRVYLTNNSNEILTQTPHDVSFNSENPPYWRYSYYPDVSSSFISFGAPGPATPPRSISNGPGLWSGTANQPNGNGQVPAPTIDYRTINIQGKNNNDRPFSDPSGSPAAAPSDANCAADASMSLPFNQLGSFNLKVQYGFDLSGEYHYPLQPTSNGASNPTRPWGEQFDVSAVTLTGVSYETVEMTDNSWQSEDISGPNLTNPSKTTNNIIYPGHTYYISNYRMKMAGTAATATNWVNSEMFLPLGGGDQDNNPSINHVPLVVPPPTLTNLSSTYNTYLSSSALFDPDPTDAHIGTQYSVIGNGTPYSIYENGSNSPFGFPVLFFATDSSYNFNSSVRKCINNKDDSTVGYNLTDGSRNRIGKSLGIWDSTSNSYIDPSTNAAVNGLSRFELKQDGSSVGAATATTDYSEGWYDPAGSDQGDSANNGTLNVYRSFSKEAYTATGSGTEYDRLHGWFLGIDASASVININLANYPDIADSNSYDPYNFNLKQYINTTTNVNPTGTQVGSTSEYDLYISKYSDEDISWNPNVFYSCNNSNIASVFRT